MTDIIGCHPNLQWNRIQFQGNDSLGGTQRYSTSMMRKGHLVLQMARHGYRVSIPAFKFTLYTMETHLLQLHDTVCGLETLFMSNLKEKLSYEIQKHSKNTAHLKSQVTLTHLIGTSLTHLFFFSPWPTWSSSSQRSPQRGRGGTGGTGATAEVKVEGPSCEVCWLV